jgi:hypothetical protein
MQPSDRPDIEALFSEGKVLERAAQRAVREALRRHKLLGESIVVWENGRIVEIPPEEIVITEDDEEGA